MVLLNESLVGLEQNFVFFTTHFAPQLLQTTAACEERKKPCKMARKGILGAQALRVFPVYFCFISCFLFFFFYLFVFFLSFFFHLRFLFCLRGFFFIYVVSVFCLRGFFFICAFSFLLVCFLFYLSAF